MSKYQKEHDELGTHLMKYGWIAEAIAWILFALTVAITFYRSM